jgi:transcriptional regulator with GAF, ATPase, and Fis domain
MRLHQDGDFPYYIHIGFPEFFIQKENTLTFTDEDGKVSLDASGAPFLECMCGNVLKKRINSQRPFFTKQGAFWTNSTTHLLSTLTEEEQHEIGRTRNTCHNYGYESVALIPIHAGTNTIGLIQINDSRENMFTLEKIKKYQRLADHVGTIFVNIVEFHQKVAEAKIASENAYTEK